MGLRFRQSFQLFPGVRLNMGKNGVSASFGAPGATVNVSRRGVRGTVGIPGSGISYSQELFKFNNGGGSNAGGQRQPRPNFFIPDDAEIYVPLVEGGNVYRSAAVESLTSDGLKPLRELIITANKQQQEIREDLKEAREEEKKQRTKLERRRKSIFRFLFKRSIAELEESLPTVSAEVQRLEEWEANTKIKIQFSDDENCQYVYGELVKAFDDLAKCSRVWDITSDVPVDQFRDRSNATRSVFRKPVAFEFVNNDLIEFEGKAMRFENANGDDILIYPGIALIPRADGVFALVDLRELRIEGKQQLFIEHETVPADAEIVDHTWHKTNKDGSRDRRFRDNFRIPVCNYGELNFFSAKGIREQYQVSRCQPAIYFASVFEIYKQALRQAAQNAATADVRTSSDPRITYDGRHRLDH